MSSQLPSQNPTNAAPSTLPPGATYPPPGATYPPPGAMYPIYPGYLYIVPEKGKGMAIAGFAVGLVSLVVWIIPTIGLAFDVIIAILGFIFSLLGMKSKTLKGLAIAGLVLSIIGAIITVLFIYNAYIYTSNGWPNPYPH